MAKKHVVKFYALQVRKGMDVNEIPEDIRAEVIDVAKSLPPKENKLEQQTSENV